MSGHTPEDGPRLPPRPQPPDPSECCNNSCDPCVFEVWEDAVDRWEARCERILARWRERHGEDQG